MLFLVCVSKAWSLCLLCWLVSKNTSKSTQRPLITLLEGEIRPRAKQLCLRPSLIHFKVMF